MLEHVRHRKPVKQSHYVRKSLVKGGDIGICVFHKTRVDAVKNCMRGFMCDDIGRKTCKYQSIWEVGPIHTSGGLKIPEQDGAFFRVVICVSIAKGMGI